MHRFEDDLTVYANMPAYPMTQTAAPMTQAAAIPMPAANTEANTKCYNCCKLGGIGHSHRECSNPQRVLQNLNSKVPIAATADPIFDDYEFPESTYFNSVNIMNTVSAKLLNYMTTGTMFNNFPSLLDIGSPVSFISYSSLSEDTVKLLKNRKPR